MRKIIGLMLVCTLAFVHLGHAQVRVLKGEVKYVDKDESTNPAAGLEVLVKPLQGTATTDNNGIFSVALPQAYKSGERLIFEIKNELWRIWTPVGGYDRIPRNLSKEMIRIQLLPKGSKKFWTDEFIEIFIEETAEKAKLQVKAEDKRQEVDFGPMIKDWATEYGFTPHEAKAQIDKWVKETEEKQEDFYKLGLAAFAKKNFQRAAELFEIHAQRYAKQFETLSEAGEEIRRKTIKSYRKAGHSHSSSYQPVQALKAYEHALNFVDKQTNLLLWADVQLEIGVANLEIGTQIEGALLHEHLLRAIRVVEQAAIVYEDMGQQKALALAWSEKSAVLYALGIRTRGEEGQRLLGEAAEAIRAALEVHTRAQFPQLWALTQWNLGNVLTALGVRTTGRQGWWLLNSAVKAYQAALEVYTQEAQSQDWAIIQVSLGDVLRAKGERAHGIKNVLRLLGEAEGAYRAALAVNTRTQFPQEWAATMRGLGNVLLAQGILIGGEEGQRLLGEAEWAYREALPVITQEQHAQQWAGTQSHLGIVLKEQGIRTGGAEGQRMLGEAVRAHRAALEVYTREQLPQQWAGTQNNLGIALVAEGIRVWGEEGRRLLGEAERAYNAALEVTTRQALPGLWTTLRTNRTKARLFQQKWEKVVEDVAALQGVPFIGPERNIVFQVLEIIALSGLNQQNKILRKMETLKDTIDTQAEKFYIAENFEETKIFIHRADEFVSTRAWLLKFIDGFEGQDKATMLAAVQNSQSKFVAAMSDNVQ